MKTNAIVRIVIYSLLIFILIGILGGVLQNTLPFPNEKIQRDDIHVPTESNIESTQMDFPAQVQNIEIDWVAGSITIHPSDSLEHINVNESFRDVASPEMICRQTGHTLKIEFAEEHEKYHLFGNNESVRKDLVIRVPADWNCNAVKIDAAAADVAISGLQINELDYDGASGNLFMENCNIVDLDVDTASGDVEFSGILKDLDFDSASAKFYGEFLQMPNHLNLDAMSGDMELVLPEYCRFTCELDTMSGSFVTDFETTQENGIYICGDKEKACHIKISAMSGNVSILKGLTAPETTK